MHKDTFYYHPKPSEDQQVKLVEIGAVFTSALQGIERIVPEGRYRSAAITVLEQAAALATKGIFHNGDGSFS